MDKWLKLNDHTKEEIMNAIYLEQFIEALPYPTLRQHSNLTPKQAVDMASSYTRAQPRHIPWEPKKPNRTAPSSRKPLRPIKEPIRIPPPKNEGPPFKGPQCYDCGGWCHIARACPRKWEEEPMDVSCVPKSILYTAELGPSFYVSVSVNDTPVLALLDSGCRQSVIRAELIKKEQYLIGRHTHIRCVHGDVREYLLAEIPLRCHDETLSLVNVGPVPCLPEPLILGTDNPVSGAYEEECTGNYWGCWGTR